MAQDNKIIASLSPADLVALLRETASIAVLESAVADGKPVIQAAVKAVNAQTGEVLAGGLPFSIVMFKAPTETGYSNIAIGTVIPATELDIRLPRDYFNFCNQRLRFVRVFPLDAGSFVIQMDLMLRGATREYVKFQFGLWGVLFQQVLFELIGSGRESLIHAAEVFAATDVAQHYVSTLSDQAVEEGPANTEPSLGQSAEPTLETTQSLSVAEDAPQPEQTLSEPPHAEASLDEAVAVPVEEAPPPHSDAYEARSENAMMMADPAEGKDEHELASVEIPAESEAFAVTLLETPVDSGMPECTAPEEKTEAAL